jgi:chemotaxis protein histidine kinase CheA
LLDRVASGVGECLRIEEQRHIAPTRSPTEHAAAGGAAQRKKEARDWARGAARGWSNFLRRLGEELGTLVKLQVVDAQLVPPALRRDIDNMLQHLLRNAVEHGIETPEQRLAADKPVTGEITIRFRNLERQGMTMSVRDDGRGFDIERIGRAAVRSGVLSEESLLEYEPGEVVGLIFKPAFSTENLPGEAGRGRGMSYLRRAVARLGGQMTVATKPGVYTRFVIQLPADAVADESPVTSR